MELRRATLACMNKLALKSLDPAKLEDWLLERVRPPWRVKAVKKWIYAKGALDWDEMSDLPQALRSQLAEEASLCSVEKVREQHSAIDGSVKVLLKLSDGETVEAVRMASKRHPTFCLSSQVGCPLDCVFCETGRMGFRRNLSQDEIIDQVLVLQRDLPADGPKPNLVFMGMGEPLMNYEALLGALTWLGEEDGLAYGGRRITVSTAGLPKRIEDLADSPVKVGLALSLNAADHDTRQLIMPALHKHRVEDLLKACEAYAVKTGRRVTLEYVLLAGVNDRDEDIRNLTRLIRRRPFKLNVIPYNPGATQVRIALPGVPGQVPLVKPNAAQVDRFVGRLAAGASAITVRWSQGTDIGGGCGQLRGMDQD